MPLPPEEPTPQEQPPEAPEEQAQALESQDSEEDSPEDEQKQRLLEAEADEKTFLRLASTPGLQPARLAVFRNLARSAAAEVKMRKRALGLPLNEAAQASENPEAALNPEQNPPDQPMTNSSLPNPSM